MTNIIPTISAAGLGIVTFEPLADVTPFSIRSGASYEDILSTIRAWLRDELVPYLNDNSAEAIFQSNADTLVDRVNTALTDQAGIVTAALNAAVQEVVTADIPIADAVVVGVLNTLTSATRQWADTHYGAGVSAPDPSGGDDTATLLALINLYGTVHLQAGVYRCNLDIVNRFIQPQIIGAGRGFTTLRPYTNSKPVVKFNGGSGAPAGGGLRAVNIDTTGTPGGGLGVVFSGCGLVTVEDVNVQGDFDEAVRFWNERTGDFTEFCTFEGAIYNARRPVRYVVDNTVESFHGSGLVGNTVIGMADSCTGPAILVENPALPYNAPLSVTVFFASNKDQWFISYANGNANRHASFYGNVRFENHPQSAGVDPSIGRGTARVYLIGGITWLGSGQCYLGNIYLATKVTYEGGEILAELRPVSFSGGLKNSPTQFIPGILKPGELGHVAVNVTGPNYHKAYMLTVFQSPYDATGTVQANKIYDLDSGNIGDPAFSWTGSGLYITNPNFTTAHSIQAQISPRGGEIRGDNLQQLRG